MYRGVLFLLALAACTSALAPAEESRLVVQILANSASDCTGAVLTGASSETVLSLLPSNYGECTDNTLDATYNVEVVEGPSDGYCNHGANVRLAFGSDCNAPSKSEYTAQIGGKDCVEHNGRLFRLRCENGQRITVNTYDSCGNTDGNPLTGTQYTTDECNDGNASDTMYECFILENFTAQDSETTRQYVIREKTFGLTGGSCLGDGTPTQRTAGCETLNGINTVHACAPIVFGAAPSPPPPVSRRVTTPRNSATAARAAGVVILLLFLVAVVVI